MATTSGTSTTELDCLLSKSLARTKVRPLGVFAADTVPYDQLSRSAPDTRTRHDNVAFIVNSDKGSRPGEHWLAFLSLSGGNTLEFFDSYGLPMSDYPNIRAHMPTHLLSRVRKRNTYCLQSLNSASCGEYCILFLTCRAHGTTFDRFVTDLKSTFSNDRRARDRYVCKTVAKLRAVVPCVPNRCTSAAADQCCLAPAACARRMSHN